MKILGIDPGSIKTGYGVLEAKAGCDLRVIAQGTLRAPAREALPVRLKAIFAGLQDLLILHEPQVVVVEEVFFARDVKSALVLGHARGAILLAAELRNIPIASYATTVVKQAVSGSGRADKLQIQKMVSVLLKLATPPEEDAADALALALCHAQSARMRTQMGNEKRDRLSRGKVISQI